MLGCKERDQVGFDRFLQCDTLNWTLVFVGQMDLMKFADSVISLAVNGPRGCCWVVFFPPTRRRELRICSIDMAVDG